MQQHDSAQELCESRDGPSCAPVPNKPTVSVDVKQHFNQQQDEEEATLTRAADSSRIHPEQHAREIGGSGREVL